MGVTQQNVRAAVAVHVAGGRDVIAVRELADPGSQFNCRAVHLPQRHIAAVAAQQNVGVTVAVEIAGAGDVITLAGSGATPAAVFTVGPFISQIATNALSLRSRIRRSDHRRRNRRCRPCYSPPGSGPTPASTLTVGPFISHMATKLSLRCRRTSASPSPSKSPVPATVKSVDNGPTPAASSDSGAVHFHATTYPLLWSRNSRSKAQERPSGR